MWKRRNFFIINKENYIKSNADNLKKIVWILNTDKLVIVSGQKNIWKLNFIKELLHKTKITSNYFYFNKSDDIENSIIDNNNLTILLNDFVQLYKKPKIIILQNISQIEWIKDFITDIYKENYKIILVWNDIKIWWISEIEILNNIVLNIENLNNSLKYWSINELKTFDSNDVKEKYLKLVTNDIFLNDIFNKFWVKNIDLYKFTISYLAENNIFLSLRDLHKNLCEIQNISLKTLIDYIDYSIQIKLLKRVYKFDMKTNKTISTKAKYYFNDNWIRNCLYDFHLNKNLLLENLIFNKLDYKNYEVFSWINWKFEFNFYWIKEEEKIFIHISNQTRRDDIKKEVSKLLKIWIEWNKYLLVENLDKLWIKKLKYDSVEIMEIENFLINK